MSKKKLAAFAFVTLIAAVLAYAAWLWYRFPKWNS